MKVALIETALDSDYPPLSLASLAAYLETKGHVARVFDLQIRSVRARWREDLAAFAPGLVGITAMTPSIGVARRAAPTDRASGQEPGYCHTCPGLSASSSTSSPSPAALQAFCLPSGRRMPASIWKPCPSLTMERSFPKSSGWQNSIGRSPITISSFRCLREPTIRCYDGGWPPATLLQKRLISWMGSTRFRIINRIRI